MSSLKQFRVYEISYYAAQKMKLSIKNLFSKCDQIRRELRIWSHLLKKSLMENFIFCAVLLTAQLKNTAVNKMLVAALSAVLKQ